VENTWAKRYLGFSMGALLLLVSQKMAGFNEETIVESRGGGTKLKF